MIQQDLFPDDRYHANWRWLNPDFDDVATSHDEAWTTAMALARSPEVQQVAARIG